jgi:hypothetical protein
MKADGLPDFHGHLQAISNGTYRGERAMVAEAWVTPLDRLARYVRPATRRPWRLAGTAVIQKLTHRSNVSRQLRKGSAARSEARTRADAASAASRLESGDAV